MLSLSSLRSLILTTALSLISLGCNNKPPNQTVPPPLSTSAPLFREVAQNLGLRFSWGQGKRTPLTILDTAKGGAAFLDYDNDGFLDILLVGSRIALYHNVAGKRFEEVSATSGLSSTGDLMGCAIGDIDNDGYEDICITGYKALRLYRNIKGTGRFEDITAKAHLPLQTPNDWNTSAGFADLDGDGLLDLVVCRYVEFTPQSRQFCEYPNPSGTPILASCPPLYYPLQKVRLFRNRGSGIFEEHSAQLPKAHGASLGVSFADFDGDGRIDFYVANDGQPGDLYHNEGMFHFTNVGTKSGTAYNQDGQEQAGMGVDWGDYDGDGLLDLAITTFDNEAKSLYHNDGHGYFTYSSYLAGLGDTSKSRLAFGVCFIDLENSGFPSLLMANGHVQDTINSIRPPATFAQPLALFRNRGDGTFQPADSEGGSAFQKPIVGRAVAVGDYDNDGRMDVLVADAEGQPLLLHNESQSPHAWLGLRLKSRYGGRVPLGARATVTLDKKTRMGEVQSCRSYLAASDTRLHFGLGTESSISRITVRWLNGKTETLEKPVLNQYLTVVERVTP